jgi:alpha-galactosidase
MSMENSIKIQHEQINFGLVSTDKSLLQYCFIPAEVNEEHIEREASPLVWCSIAGENTGGLQTNLHAYYNMPRRLELKEDLETEKGRIITYKDPKSGLILETKLDYVKNTSIIRYLTTAINETENKITLTHLSSAYVQGICLDGLMDWFDDNKIRVHICRQTWHGEGQWQTCTLRELGLYAAHNHISGSSIQIGSVGTFSTSRLMPVIIIEDLETSQSYFCQIETSGSWNIEIGYKGNYANASLYLLASAADENSSGFKVVLDKNGTFTSEPAAVGCVKGGFFEAVKELTKYRRSLIPETTPKELPVVFNDYMNCLWGNPSRERLLPLIEKASSIGAEVFCIDAGWYYDGFESWEGNFGDWMPGNIKFGEEGLQGILDYIKSKNMTPGLWLELEVCSEDANLYKMPDEYFLMRDGFRVEGEVRTFLNYTNPKVRVYMHEVIDRLVGMGVGYFKNDYNLSTGLGADNIGCSAAHGILENSRAFLSFIDEILQKHTGLIIEACASGGMRSDYSTLSHFHLSSSSDQIRYERYPSIICGSLCNVVPEQLGIWCYPNPSPIDVEADKVEELLFSREYIESFSDGEQTVYNIINGMCGNLYLSGRIDCMDDFNTDILMHGVALYKKEREFIRNAYPFQPLPLKHINNRNTWHSIGLINDSCTRALLAVWKNSSDQDNEVLNLAPFKGKDVIISEFFPQKGDTRIYLDKLGGKLTMRLKGSQKARLFEIIVV